MFWRDGAPHQDLPVWQRRSPCVRALQVNQTLTHVLWKPSWQYKNHKLKKKVSGGGGSNIYVPTLMFGRNSATVFSPKIGLGDGGQGLFETFQKINPFGNPGLPLSLFCVSSNHLQAGPKTTTLSNLQKENHRKSNCNGELPQGISIFFLDAIASF